ncbi:MAG TPA: hypothetical protein GX695_01615 [Acholeplasmataceae bacterium]|nr:hypothetical protein [Acholeplasmataceae bacterium]
MNIKIDKTIKNILPDFSILAFKMDVNYNEEDALDELIVSTEKKVFNKYTLKDVLQVPLIKEARDGYKKMGKDPSRYRLSCESLLRRIVKGNSLYRINNLVDLGNILSIETNRSVAVLDYDKIIGDITIRMGTKDDEYYGIGRGLINVSNIPVYEDTVSPFGSTTSDTERTMITKHTKTILLFLIYFKKAEYIEDGKLAISMYEEYANGRNIESKYIT